MPRGIPKSKSDAERIANAIEQLKPIHLQLIAQLDALRAKRDEIDKEMSALNGRACYIRDALFNLGQFEKK